MSGTTEATETPKPEPKPDVQRAVEIAVRLAVLCVLTAWCLWIVSPFVTLVVWGLIIAIGVDGFYLRVRTALGGRSVLAAVAVVLLALVLLVVPAVLLSETLISGAQHFARQLESDGFRVPPPPAKVEAWPVVGELVYSAWLRASENLTEALRPLKPQLLAASRWLFGAAGSAGVGLLQLVGSLIVAGVFLARSEGRDVVVKSVATRLTGVRGTELVDLANATVRSVVQGIVGVAIIQAVLAGLGLIVAGVPGAGLWALLVLVAAVVQLPVALVLIPPVLLVYSSSSTTVTVVFLGWSLFVTLIDNVLKPILFGRGVKVPTVVIFIGAIGGMLSMGIMGLFLGAVVLTLGYETLRAWIGETVAEGDAAG
jgi:predicted PurR-regulated permease PerM